MNGSQQDHAGPVAVARYCRCGGRAEIDGFVSSTGSVSVRCTRCGKTWVSIPGGKRPTLSDGGNRGQVP